MRQHLAIAACLALVWLIGEGVFRENLGSELRFFTDNYERDVYAQRGAWAIDGRVPYRDVFSEYPQVATYVLGLPYLVVGDDRTAYLSVFSLMMCVWLGATIILLRQMLAEGKSRAYLLLLPPVLYFAYNRFDLVSSFFVLLSLWCVDRRRHAATGVCLAVATLTKWYPALLLPLVLSYEYRRERRFDWALVAAFGVTSALIVAPILVAGGLRAVAQPYAYHAGRGLELVSLPALVYEASKQGLGFDLGQRLVRVTCLGLVIAVVLASVVARVESVDKLARWSLAVIASSVLVSPICSPQWILWLLPLMILTARNRRDVSWIVAYAILNYLAFPLIYDIVGHASLPLAVVSLLVFGILLRTVIVSARTESQHVG